MNQFHGSAIYLILIVTDFGGEHIGSPLQISNSVGVDLCVNPCKRMKTTVIPRDPKIYNVGWAMSFYCPP